MIRVLQVVGSLEYDIRKESVKLQNFYLEQKR